MSRSAGSIKELLSDARFYEEPHRYPERLALAEKVASLRTSGQAKESILTELGASRMLGLRAYRDASVMRSTDH